MSRKALLRVLLVVAGLLGTYWASTYFMAYTDDAYVTTDLIRVTPRVAGRLVGVHVTDNQAVKRGDLLVTIDPEPFRLKVNQDRAEVEAAQAMEVLLQRKVAKAQADLKNAGSRLDLARVTEERKRFLLAGRDIAQQEYDEAQAAMREAEDAVEAAAAALAETEEAVKAQEPVIQAAQAAQAKAVYDLEQTRVLAPQDGWVNALDLKPGDDASVGVPLLGLVAAEGWRVMADYREYLTRHMRPGQTVIVYFDGHPWRLFRGTVQGVARGVSRQADPHKILPYVDPKTDWIRLARRFPVRVELPDLPPELTLRLGADARTLVIY